MRPPPARTRSSPATNPAPEPRPTTSRPASASPKEASSSRIAFAERRGHAGDERHPVGSDRSDQIPAGSCDARCVRKRAVVSRPMTASEVPYASASGSATAPTFDTFHVRKHPTASPAATASSFRLPPGRFAAGLTTRVRAYSDLVRPRPVSSRLVRRWAPSRVRHDLGADTSQATRYVVFDGDGGDSLGKGIEPRRGGGAPACRRQALHDAGRAPRVTHRGAARAVLVRDGREGAAWPRDHA